MSVRYAVQHEDELEGVVATPSVQTQAPAPVAARIPEEDPADDFTAPGAEDEIDWGTTVSAGDGLEQLRSKKNEFLRFALVPTSKPRAKRVHFVQLAGQRKERPYLCTGDPQTCPACLRGVVAKPRVVALAVHYVDADTSSAALSKTTKPVYQIGYLSLSASAFTLLQLSPPEGSKVVDIDLAMTYDGDRYGFKSLTTPPRYVVRGDLDRITAMAQPFLGLLARKLGSPLPVNANFGPKPELAEGWGE